MFGLNELILPILGGYVFITQWFVTRYLARQWAGYRLFFNSTIAGFIFFALSVMLLSLCKKWILQSDYLLNSLFPSNYAYLDASVISFLLGVSSWLVLNFFQKDKENLAVKYAEKFGGPLQVLLAKAFSETRQIAVTLRSGRVYMGFVTKLNEVQDKQEYVLIWPQFSGYRDSETKRVKITTNYSPVYKEIMDEPERFSNISINDFQVILPTADIESISIFDPQVYACFKRNEEPST